MAGIFVVVFEYVKDRNAEDKAIKDEEMAEARARDAEAREEKRTRDAEARAIEESQRSREMELILFKGGLNTLLFVILKSIRLYQGRTDTDSLRINIMIVEENVLRIFDQIGMSNPAEIALIYSVGQGCCGFCATTGQAKIADLRKFYFDTYEESCKRLGDISPWGISKYHWEMTRDLKSILSFPINDLQNGQKIIAVLNLDDTIDLEESQFMDDNVFKLLESLAPKIAQNIVMCREGAPEWLRQRMLRSIIG